MSILSIKKRLNYLYSKQDADYAFRSIRKLLQKYPSEKKKPKRFSQEDAILITYGDSIKEKGKTLKTFKKFSKKIKGKINTIHFLPFFPYSSDDGFSVIDYGKINPDFGNWDDVNEIGKDFDLMFDFVLNHISAKSIWFKGYLKDNPKYKDFFFDIPKGTDLSKVFRPRMHPLLTRFGKKNVWTTFSADQVDLNFHNPKVLVAMIDYLLFFAKNGARKIRLDAIAYLWKEIGTDCLHLKQTHEVVKLIHDVLELNNPNVLLVTETNVPHKENISYFGKNGDEAQMVYQFPLPPLVLHAFLKQDSTYISRWLKSIGSLSKDITFFNFLASHDGIGVLPAKGLIPEKDRLELVKTTKRHNGDIGYKTTSKGKEPYELNINYFDALSDPNSKETDDIRSKRFVAAYSIALSLQGIPGIYIHSLLGSRNCYAGVKSSGIKRRINREKLNYKKLEKELNTNFIRFEVFNQLLNLLDIRKKHPAFSPEAKQKILNLGKNVIAIERKSKDEKITCLINITDKEIKLNTNLRGIDLISKQKIDKGVILESYQKRWIK